MNSNRHCKQQKARHSRLSFFEMKEEANVAASGLNYKVGIFVNDSSVWKFVVLLLPILQMLKPISRIRLTHSLLLFFNFVLNLQLSKNGTIDSAISQPLYYVRRYAFNLQLQKKCIL